MNRPRNAAAPGLETEGEGSTDQPGGLVPSVQATAPTVTDPASSYFRNCHAVLVQGKATRRHPYFNLPAAERCVLRATARGDVAAMVLVQLVPVQIIPLRGGEDD